MTAVVALAGVLVLTACGRSDRAPVVVIGLDGADFDLLLPWLEAGELPNLKAFLDEAAVGDLTTVYPILSPVCWTSAVTGVNPGKHGIFDFQKQDPAGGDPLIETATHRRALPLWMLLSDTGHRVGVMNVPMTYPPDPVRGAMISGFPFPSGEVNITYPPELHAQLPDYPLDFLGLTLFSRTPDEMYADFLKGQEARRRVALDWIGSGKYGFLWLVFTGPDKVQHFFWKYMDPDHPNHDPALANRLGGNILELWKKQDAILGEVLAALPENATVMMLSDHGFDGIYRQVNLANWLATTELPKWLQSHAIPPLNITNGILHYILEGQLTGGSDREAFVDKFIDLCGRLEDPETGQKPIENMFRREEIYSGRMEVKAPDIVFQETPKYFVTRGVVDSLDLPTFQDVWTTSFSAHHRPEGILAVRSPMVVRSSEGSLRERLAGGGDYDKANIMDVAPTLLALMQESIPEAMDGRVLEEVLDPAFLAGHPIVIEKIEGFLLDRLPPSELSPEDRERYKAIPYIN
jgi:predicted AlkP superfamily phosphohydrolase/phosphomutase